MLDLILRLLYELVCSATISPTAVPEMCYSCFDTLIHRINGKFTAAPGVPGWHGAVTEVSCPIFVTWEIRNGAKDWKLRGCIGTLRPTPLISSLPKYALTSALQDTRFAPISKGEIPYLRCSVSLLVRYEDCQTLWDWDIIIHGIIISWKSKETPIHQYSATYLPDVAKGQGWNQRQTIDSLVRKAGYHGPITEELLGLIRCRRYQSSKCSVSYDDYCKVRGHSQPVTGTSCRLL